jgi:hypothetical protein
MFGSATLQHLFPAFVGATSLALLALSTGAAAAPVKKVLGACDNTPGCNYSINDKNGDISGCSTKSGTCFYCPNDGKRQCFAVRKLPAAGKRPELLSGEVTLTK